MGGRMKLVYNDSSHSYWLDGKRVKSASKVAQIAADSYTIEQWQQRQVAIGMTLDQTLTERVAVDVDNREAIEKVVEDAHQAAKSQARARRGTQRHRVLELLLLGKRYALITDQQRADAEVLQRTLDRYGLEPVPDRVEQFVAWPERGVVGRYDAILRRSDRLVLCDLKGGINAVKYPHSTAVQLALYRFAPTTSAAIERDGDKSIVTEWTGWPDYLDNEVAYVIYCDDDHDVGELYEIDLRHGRKGADLALSIVGWRKQHNYGRDLAQPVESPIFVAGGVIGPAQPVVLSTDELRPTPDRRQALRQRYTALDDAGKAHFNNIAPANSDLDAIEAALDKADPFQHTVIPPVTPEPTTPPQAPTLPSAPDEGAAVDDASFEALGRRYKPLSRPVRAWIWHIVETAQHADVPFHANKSTGRRTLRRFEITRGLILLAEAGHCDDELVRELVATVWQSDTAFFPTSTVGHVVGAMTAEEASRFSSLCFDLCVDVASVDLRTRGAVA